MKIWAIVGESAQNIQETQPNENCIEMQDLRPSDANYIAVEGGVWELAPPTPNELKLKGVEFEGIMCSATAKDQFGLTGVVMYIRSGHNILPFQFENGNFLQLTAENVDAFELVWLPFRESFFQ